MSTTEITRLRTSRRYTWTGPAAGILCMIATFVHGAILGSTALMAAAFTGTVLSVVIWFASERTLDARIARLERA